VRDEIELEMERVRARIFRKVAALSGPRSWVAASVPPEPDDPRLPESKTSGPCGRPGRMGETPATPVAGSMRLP